MFLAIFEFLGTSELLIILVVALIIFGPRKLPQMSRKLGQSLSEFKRASEDFKRTWEKEVEMEKIEEEGRQARAMFEDDSPAIGDTVRNSSELDAAAIDEPWAARETVEPTVARSSSHGAAEQSQSRAAALPPDPAPETPGKRDWL